MFFKNNTKDFEDVLVVVTFLYVTHNHKTEKREEKEFLSNC